MCKSIAEGGQRCAAHTKARLEAASVTMRTEAERCTDERNLPRFHKAREAWETAAVDYASTPAGAEAFEARKVQAEADQDVQTVAMLDSIIRRGRAMREANDQIRAALALGAFTETNLPEPEGAANLASDENNNPLAEADQQAWGTLLKYLASGESDSQAQGERLAADDRTVAAATSTDDDLTGVMWRLSRYLPEHEDWVRHQTTDEFGYDDYDDYYGSHIEAYVGQTHGDAIRAQVRRVLGHPNAGLSTFSVAKSHLSVNEVLSHPNCPVATIAGTPAWVAERIDRPTWKRLRLRRDESLAMTVFVAANDPDEYAREDARLAIVATRWENLTADEMKTLRSALPTCLSTSQAAMVEQSMTEWVRFFGDDNTKEKVLGASALQRV